MFAFSPREKILLLTVFLSLVSVEGVLELQSSIERKHFSQMVRPIYSFELQDSSGNTLSSSQGHIKLGLDPVAGFVNKPNTQTPYFSIDNLGFREVPHSSVDSPSATVALLGGSTAFSTGATNDHTTYADYVARQLETVRIINAATIGHTSANELGLFTSRLIDRDLTAVVALTGWNDFQQWKSTQPNGYVDQIEGQLLQLKRARNHNILARWPLGLTSTFIPAIQDRIEKLTSDQFTLELPGIGVIRNAQRSNDPSQAADYFIRNRKIIDRIATALGIESCTILQPDIASLESERRGLQHGYTIFRSEVLRRANEEGMVIFDAGTSPSPLQAEHFTDDIHLSDDGNRVLAEHTLPFIKSCLLKARRSPSRLATRTGSKK